MSKQRKARSLSQPDVQEEEEFNCAKCPQPDSAEDMVECDSCKRWFHYSCGGVDESIQDKDFHCDVCVKKSEKPPSVRKERSQKSIKSSTSSVRAARIALQLKQLEEEKALREKYLEEQRSLHEQQRREEEARREEAAKQEAEYQKSQLAEQMKLETEYLQKRFELENAQLDEEEESCSRSVSDRLSRVSRIKEWLKEQEDGKIVSEVLPPEEGRNDKPSTECLPKPPLVPQKQQELFRTPLKSESSVSRYHSVLSEGNVQQHPACPVASSRNSLGQMGNVQFIPKHESDVVTKLEYLDICPGTGIGRRQVGTYSEMPFPNPRVGLVPTPMNAYQLEQKDDELIQKRQTRGYRLTPDQAAARQVMPRDLPSFDGNPEDWPVFISCFTMTTEACGYSEVENLIRLQRALRGAALEAVRSRLLLPSSVPDVISTLQFLYGRPELIINTLLKKIRDVPAPRAERLETLIAFGMAVQNFCSHLVAAGQNLHLKNPMLLQELVDKLPNNFKLDWALYRQRLGVEVGLKEFGSYMSTLVTAASSVTVCIGLEPGKGQKEKANSKFKDKSFVNAHDSNDSKDTKAGSGHSLDVSEDKICLMCRSSEHAADTCQEFRNLTVEQRWKEIYERQMCRVCLGPYNKRVCDVKVSCGVDGCKKRHHRLLHLPSSQPEKGPESPTVAVNTHHREQSSMLFKIIPVTVHGRNASVDTYAFLDDGSSLTLMEQTLADEIGLEGDEEPLCLVWTANVTRSEPKSKRVEMEISEMGSSRTYAVTNVRTVDDLVLPNQTLDSEALKNDFKHLKGLPLPSYKNVAPRLLIGINNSHLAVSQKKREGAIGEPVAVKTRLGWAVYGGTGSCSDRINFHVEACSCDGLGRSDDQLHEMVRQFFDVEGAGVNLGVDFTMPESAEMSRARDMLESRTLRVGSRFVTGLLWRNDEVQLPDSYSMALRRLSCLERRLKKDQSLRDSVQRQIDGYVEKGYAHKATQQELELADRQGIQRVWYLPLGVVINDKKPGKIRLISDAAATVNGVSLNSMLLKGPDQLVALPKVLSRFRQRLVAISGDIKEMYHQIRIRDEDKHAQRFLWRSNPNDVPDTYIMDVATFGATCSPSIAQYIKNLNAEEFSAESPKAVDAIVNSHYVDDFLDSCDTESEAMLLAEEVRRIHAAGGFEIRNWVSNSQQVLDSLEKGSLEREVKLPIDKTGKVVSQRVLGLVWRPNEDVFVFSSEIGGDLEAILTGSRVPTKREVLKCVMRIFDPLGMLSHFVVQGKMIIQDIWRYGTDWDEVIPDEIATRWLEWISLLKQLDQLRIPRCYFKVPKQPEAIELHVFVDASEGAYAAVAYFRAVVQGEVRCTMVMGKSKVAPIKPISIPRMELQAAVLGVRLANAVVSNHDLPITKRIFWSDSHTVLSWIQSDQRNYKQFVAYRIGEILSSTSIGEWRWVPSKQNAADDATKWTRGTTLSSNCRWYAGPQFLYGSESSWPARVLPSVNTEEEQRVCLVHSQEVVSVAPVVDFSRFSKWERLHRAMGYVIRFIRNYWRIKKGFPAIKTALTASELQVAERSIWRMVQSDKFRDEVSLLRVQRLHPDDRSVKLEKSSPLYQLSPRMDEHGIIRADHRIGLMTGLSEYTKYPVILPKEHVVTDLLLDSYHRRYLHANRELIVNEVQQKFHVPRLRTAVNRVRASCQTCKIVKTKPKVPRMAPLPAARLQAYSRPFSYVGLDFFGPLTVKVGRRNEKRWVALFTCLVTRAVHLEVAHSLSTESCKLAIRRFIADRGSPLEIYSDNGTNFVGASRDLKREIEERNETLAEAFTNTTTKWIFNPPSAPHMGGVWERMVRSVKTALGSMPSSSKPNDETLLTVLAEAKAIVNSRPLTFVSLNGEDDEALTPNHFLMLSSSGVTQPPRKLLSEGVNLRVNWNLAQSLADHFWKRWVREYLPVIARRTKWFEETKPLEPGDLVVIADGEKRSSWIRGRITEVFRGSDGRVRQALVKTASGNVMRRPASKLALLDVAPNGKTVPNSQCYGENVDAIDNSGRTGL